MARFQHLSDHFLEIILVVMRNPAQGKTADHMQPLHYCQPFTLSIRAQGKAELPCPDDGLLLIPLPILAFSLGSTTNGFSSAYVARILACCYSVL